MNNRRIFITLVPFAGAALLAACSKETTTPSATPAPAPATPPAAAPAPAMAAPAAAPSSTGAAPGASLPLLEPSDPVAVGLGYVAVASTVDGSKYKTHAPGQACSNCSLFAGTAGDSQGGCPLFAGKHVLATGWCSAYVKKAG